MILLKYLPKRDWFGKERVSLICSMLMLVDLSRALASAQTKSSMQLSAGFPVISLTDWERYFGVMQSLLA